MQKSSHLNPPLRILGALALLSLGLAPSAAFFAWVERSASLPWIGLELGWPWIDLGQWPTAALAWNSGLFLAFGVVHSLLAQPAVQCAIARVIPVQMLRALYICVTGLSLLALMGLWQNTGIVLWVAPLPTTTLMALSATLYWILMGAAAFQLRRFDPLEFVGLKQLYSSAQELHLKRPPSSLLTSGIYARVRHPLYALTVAAWILTPLMTLDRALLVANLVLYLAVAIPVEERKLVTLYGDAYLTYRSRTSAILPRILFKN